MGFFKNKIIRYTVSVLLIAALLVASDRVLDFLLRPIDHSFLFRTDVNALEKSGTQADLLFIGTSRAEKTFVPEVFEQEMGLSCVLNAGSSSQTIDGTYYLLKDLIERVHPGRVVLEVTRKSLSRSYHAASLLFIYDRVSLKNKAALALNRFRPGDLKYLISSYRFNDYLDLETIRQNIRDKNRFYETGRHRFSESEEYTGKGYTSQSTGLVTGSIPISEEVSFSEEAVTAESLGYLDACIDLCKSNGIDVILVTGVTSVMRLYTFTNYQAATDYCTRYAESKGIRYYNLNYLVGRETFLPEEYMHDFNHVNGEGGQIVSKRFAEILNKADRGEDVSSYFYKDMDALKADAHRVVSVGATAERSEENPAAVTVQVKSIHNEEYTPVYRLTLRYEDGRAEKLLSDWSEETSYTFLPEDAADFEDATLVVEAGLKDDPTYKTARQEYAVPRQNESVE